MNFNKLHTWFFSVTLIFSLLSFTGADYTYSLPSIQFSELVILQQSQTGDYQVNFQKSFGFSNPICFSFYFDVFLKQQHLEFLKAQKSQKIKSEDIPSFQVIYLQLPSTKISKEKELI